MIEVIPFLADLTEDIEFNSLWQIGRAWVAGTSSEQQFVFVSVCFLAGALPFAPPMGRILCVSLAGRLVFGGLFLGGFFKNNPSCPCLPEPTSSFVACLASAKQRVSLEFGKGAL